VVGDFNALNTGVLETDFGLLQLVSGPTHGNYCLDKVFTNRPDIFLLKFCEVW